MKSKLYLLFFSTFIFFNCKEKNNCIKNWPSCYNNDTEFIKDSMLDDCSFIIKGQFYYSNTAHSSKQRARICKHKFFIKPLDLEAEEFIFLNFDNKINEKSMINLKFGKTIKSYECILENKIKTNENILVCKFRIKKFVKLNEFFGNVILDIVLFATENHGIIGSYLSENNNSKVIISEHGDILKNDIDYSNYKFGILE